MKPQAGDKVEEHRFRIQHDLLALFKFFRHFRFRSRPADASIVLDPNEYEARCCLDMGKLRAKHELEITFGGQWYVFNKAGRLLEKGFVN